MTERIDHAAKARDALESARETPAAPEVVADPWLLTAQVHATLALVEQQKIANLLTAAVSYERFESRSEGQSYATVSQRLSAEIREGLGL